MGGRYSQGYQLFQQLTIKAFLAIRPHADQLVSTVQLMLDTCLPSFKGEPTIRRLRDRFALSLNERQAADFMMSIVRNAHENVRSTAYDEFQRVSTTLRRMPRFNLTYFWYTASKRYPLQIEAIERGEYSGALCHCINPVYRGYLSSAWCHERCRVSFNTSDEALAFYQ